MVKVMGLFRITMSDDEIYLTAGLTDYETRYAQVVERNVWLSAREIINWLESEAESGNYSSLIPIYKKIYNILLVESDDLIAEKVIAKIAEIGGFID